MPHSREATLFASMLATVIYVTFFLPDRIGRMGEVLRDLFEKPDQWQLETGPDVISLFIRIGWEVANLLLPAVALFFIFGIGSSLFQNLPTPVLDRIQPQFSRISPVSGWKRIFSTSGLVEFAKSLAKIVVVGIIMFFVLRGQFFHAIDLAGFRSADNLCAVVDHHPENSHHRAAGNRCRRYRRRAVDPVSLGRPAENDQAGGQGRDSSRPRATRSSNRASARSRATARAGA